jgi:glucokinase
MRIAAGIDIGGTNTVWGFIDQTGKVLKKGSFLTQSFDEASQFVRKLSEEMLAHLHQNPALELIGIGIGAPNGNFIKGTVELPPNLPWKGITPLKKLFLQYFEQPIWVTNDANAAATGEMLFGAAKGMKDFIVITLGTGLGSGFVSNGKLMYGSLRSGEEMLSKEMMLQGVLSIQAGDNPRSTQQKMLAFVPKQQRIKLAAAA